MILVPLFAVFIFPIVVAESLFVQIPEQMKRLDADVRFIRTALSLPRAGSASVKSPAAKPPAVHMF